FQMALAASAIGNMEGKLMKPRIEYNVAPQVFNQVMPPQTAARLRQIMGLVTGGPSGTARGVFGPVKAAGINTGGKTGWRRRSYRFTIRRRASRRRNTRWRRTTRATSFASTIK